MELKEKGRVGANSGRGKREWRTEEPSPTRGCGIAFPGETTGVGERWTEETLLHRPVSASREAPQKEDNGSLILRISVRGPIQGVTGRPGWGAAVQPL